MRVQLLGGFGIASEELVERLVILGNKIVDL
jgi:hypothetical protein